MNTGQMLLAAGGMMLMSFVFLNVNRGFASSGDVLISSKLNILSVSLAASIIEDASGKSFDELTIGENVEFLDDLSRPDKLGTDEGFEEYPLFDDFDDFNGLSLENTTSVVGLTFNINCVVEYVNENDPEVVSSEETWHKKITVNVSSPSMTDTVSISSVQSYFFFR